MPKEIKILLPDSSSEEVFDIHIQTSSQESIPSYRYEIWDLEKDNPDCLNAVDFLKQRIKDYEAKWVVAEIYAEKNKKIPILLKQNN